MPNGPIEYPYLPEGRTFGYVPEHNVFMRMAKEFAEHRSLDEVMPGGALIVRVGFIIGQGANGSNYHKEQPCQRIILGCKTGEGYEFCEGCHPKNHSESRAINHAQNSGYDTRKADLYLWGHWWCCKWCWDVMIEAGIKDVYLLEGSEALFNKNHPDNIVGKQFV